MSTTNKQQQSAPETAKRKSIKDHLLGQLANGSTNTNAANADRTNQPKKIAKTTPSKPPPPESNNNTKSAEGTAVTPMDIDDDDQTIVQSNVPLPTPSNPLTYSRCDIKLNIKGDTNDYYLEALKQIQTFFKQFQKYDEAAVIVQWKDSHAKEPEQPTITSPNDIPSDEEEAEDYFYGLNPRDRIKGPQDLWFKIKLGHSIELLDIQKKLTRFMNKRKWFLQYIRLQVEHTTCVGSILFSHGSMDFEHLSQQIERSIKYPCQCRWRIMNTGYTPGKLEEKDKIRAIHIETESKHANAAMLELSEKFGKTKSTFPGERRMRFFPEYSKVRSIENQNKIVIAKKRQGNFLNAIGKVFNNDLLILDKRAKLPTGDCLPTLRRMIGQIKSFQPGMQHLPLFHNVDLAYSRDGNASGGYCFLVMPHLRQEATMMINNLLPYLRFKHGSTVESYFSQETIDCNRHVTWDDVNKRVKSTVEDNLNEDDEDEDFIGLGLAMKYKEAEAKKDKADEEAANRPAPQAAAQPAETANNMNTGPVMDKPVTSDTPEAAYYRKGDDDSVSTMGMSATHTVGGTPHASTLSTAANSRKTLGPLEGTIIDSTKTSRSTKTTAATSISTVHEPTIVGGTAFDAQTTASAITMESMITSFERRQEKQLVAQQKMFESQLEKQMSKMMETMMTQRSAPSGSVHTSGNNAAEASSPDKEAGTGM